MNKSEIILLLLDKLTHDTDYSLVDLRHATAYKENPREPMSLETRSHHAAQDNKEG
jgi:hypothetical protein